MCSFGLAASTRRCPILVTSSPLKAAAIAVLQGSYAASIILKNRVPRTPVRSIGEMNGWYSESWNICGVLEILSCILLVRS